MALTDIREVLNERGKNYGEFAEHARIAQAIKEAMRSGPSWSSMEPYHKEALEMVGHKIARVCNGNPKYLDSFVDVIGYTQLVIDELNKNDTRY